MSVDYQSLLGLSNITGDNINIETITTNSIQITGLNKNQIIATDSTDTVVNVPLLNGQLVIGNTSTSSYNVANLTTDGTGNFIITNGPGTINLKENLSQSITNLTTSDFITSGGVVTINSGANPALNVPNGNVNFGNVLTVYKELITDTGLGLQNAGNFYNAGNVGIKTSSPSQALDVVGNALITGNIILTGSMSTSAGNVTIQNGFLSVFDNTANPTVGFFGSPFQGTSNYTEIDIYNGSTSTGGFLRGMQDLNGDYLLLGCLSTGTPFITIENYSGVYQCTMGNYASYTQGVNSLNVGGSINTTGNLVMTDPATGYATLLSPGALLQGNTFILPLTTGTVGEVLTTDGNNPANLSWSSVSGAGWLLTGNTLSTLGLLGSLNNYALSIITDNVQAVLINTQSAYQFLYNNTMTTLDSNTLQFTNYYQILHQPASASSDIYTTLDQSVFDGTNGGIGQIGSLLTNLQIEGTGLIQTITSIFVDSVTTVSGSPTVDYGYGIFVENPGVGSLLQCALYTSDLNVGVSTRNAGFGNMMINGAIIYNQNGSGFTTQLGFQTSTSNVTTNLPNTNGTAGYLLQGDGSGNLSYVSPTTLGITYHDNSVNASYNSSTTITLNGTPQNVPSLSCSLTTPNNGVNYNVFVTYTVNLHGITLNSNVYMFANSTATIGIGAPSGGYMQAITPPASTLYGAYVYTGSGLLMNYGSGAIPISPQSFAPNTTLTIVVKIYTSSSLSTTVTYNCGEQTSGSLFPICSQISAYCIPV